MYLNKKFNPTDDTDAVDITDDTNADNDSISHLGKIKTVVTELLKERLFKSYTNDLKTIINEFGLNEEAIARIYDNIMSETQKETNEQITNETQIANEKITSEWHTFFNDSHEDENGITFFNDSPKDENGITYLSDVTNDYIQKKNIY